MERELERPSLPRIDNRVQSEYSNQFNYKADLYFKTSHDQTPFRSNHSVGDKERNLELNSRSATKPQVENWNKVTHDNVVESNILRAQSEQVRKDIEKVRSQTTERIKQAQLSTEKRIGQRIEAVQHWRNEIQVEFNKLYTSSKESEELQAKCGLVLKYIQDPIKSLETVLSIRRTGNRNAGVNDSVDWYVIKIIETLNRWESKTRNNMLAVKNQIGINRASQHELELDQRDKFHALQVDQLAQSMTEISSGIGTHDGVERDDKHISTIKSWEEYTEASLRKSRLQREASKQLRERITAEFVTLLQEVRQIWQDLDAELQKRISELESAKRLLEEELLQIKTEIAASTRSIDSLRQLLNEREKPLRLAQSRLFERNRRENMEFCRDTAYRSLVNEITMLKNAVQEAQRQLHAGNTHQAALHVRRSGLDVNLKNTIRELEIDRERCHSILKIQPFEKSLLTLIEG